MVQCTAGVGAAVLRATRTFVTCDQFRSVRSHLLFIERFLFFFYLWHAFTNAFAFLFGRYVSMCVCASVVCIACCIPPLLFHLYYIYICVWNRAGPTRWQKYCVVCYRMIILSSSLLLFNIIADRKTQRKK